MTDYYERKRRDQRRVGLMIVSMVVMLMIAAIVACVGAWRAIG